MNGWTVLLDLCVYNVFFEMKGQSRFDVRKYSFSRGTVTEWNKLSADCVHSSSMCKNRIDNYLVRAGYSQIRTCGLSISQRLPCPQPYMSCCLDGNLVKSVKQCLQVHQNKSNVLVCRICEKDHDSQLVLRNHMRQCHKACEMPYICHLCNFRSSVYSDVVDHFKKVGVGTGTYRSGRTGLSTCISLAVSSENNPRWLR